MRKLPLIFLPLLLITLSACSRSPSPPTAEPPVLATQPTEQTTIPPEQINEPGQESSSQPVTEPMPEPTAPPVTEPASTAAAADTPPNTEPVSQPPQPTEPPATKSPAAPDVYKRQEPVDKCRIRYAKRIRHGLKSDLCIRRKDAFGVVNNWLSVVILFQRSAYQERRH